MEQKAFYTSRASMPFPLKCSPMLHVALLFLSVLCAGQIAAYQADPIPEWVEKVEAPLGDTPVKPSQTNTQCLLIDRQKHASEKTLYIHKALKALTQKGTKELGKIQINYDPLHEKAKVHDISIHRNGEKIDKLATAIFRKLEGDGGDSNYDGTTTLVFFLDDVRIGDIIEYSCSLIGENPLFAGKIFNVWNMQFSEAVEKWRFRLIAPEDRKLTIKNFHASPQPVARKLTPGIQEWLWELRDFPTLDSESNTPSWFNPYARISFSEYGSWQELGDQVRNLYVASEKDATPEMQALAQLWKNTAENDEDRALLALRFVQDEVRYLGIWEGTTRWQPPSPKTVFEARFGDCKGKTALLKAFLDLMGISSSPLLVHTNIGPLLVDLLPSPGEFDHVILQIEIGQKIYWVDPTLSLQGGTLKETYCPDYRYGLLLKDPCPGLVSFPGFTDQGLAQAEKIFSISGDKTVRYESIVTFHGNEADSVRRRLSSLGYDVLSKEKLEEAQKEYGFVKVVSPPHFEDDRLSNTVVRSFVYDLPVKTIGGKPGIAISSSLAEFATQRQVHPARNFPLSLLFPLHIKEHIRLNGLVVSPNSGQETYSCDHPSVFYSRTANVDQEGADYYYEAKCLLDHVPVEAMQDYWQIIDDIKDHKRINATVALP